MVVRRYPRFGDRGRGPAHGGTVVGVVSADEQHLLLPRPPEPGTTNPFPIFATIAPVVASAALFVVTQSPFALMFALLGPIVALASIGDSRRQARRQLARETKRFEGEMFQACADVEREQGLERARLNAVAPRASALFGTTVGSAERWNGSLDGSLPIVVGVGAVRTGRISASERRTAQSHPRLVELCATASTMEHAPVLVDARLGVAVVGPPAQSQAVANGLVLQLANALSPATFRLSLPRHSALSWLRALPHADVEEEGASMSNTASTNTGSANTAQANTALANTALANTESSSTIEFRARDSDRVAMIGMSHDLAGVPAGCRVVIQVGGAATGTIIRDPEPDRLGAIDPEFVSGALAHRCALVLAEDAAARGYAERNPLPAEVKFGDLARHQSAGSLACPIGIGPDGPAVVDLVSDGPHAIVGGTTGSGKSELLISWVLGMAAAAPPTAVTFLLVDFKGGASFSTILSLPHCLGVVTDLDHSGANRALASLTAELRRRERILESHSAGSIDVLDVSAQLPRLVIVVDEFATVNASFPELHYLFADIAARGRSLGVHLILCTQRPSGVVRDAVLANCALRISLRVNNTADSVAVVGTPAAAKLSRGNAGRAIVACQDGSPMPVQVAMATRTDAEKVAAQWPGRALWRPWCEPLPAQICVSDLDRFQDEPDARGVAFGVMDLPGEQRQAIVRYDPSAQGSLLILGGRNSGKSGTLAALAGRAQFSGVHYQVAQPGAEGAWDTVAATLGEVRQNTANPRIVLFDDLDVYLPQLGPDYAQALVENLVALIREGNAQGVHLVLAVTRVTPALQRVSDVCETKLLLRAADVQDHVAAGGDRGSFNPALPTGAGFWRGNRVQVVMVAADQPPVPAELPTLRLERRLAVVASAPVGVERALSSLGPITIVGGLTSPDQLTVVDSHRGARIFLGDPDAWQSHWDLLASLRADTPFAFHGCTASQFRGITRMAILPPPITSPANSLWLLEPDGTLTRARLPEVRRES